MGRRHLREEAEPGRGAWVPQVRRAAVAKALRLEKEPRGWS